VTAYNKYVSSQFDCSASNRISAGLKVDYSNLILKEKNRWSIALIRNSNHNVLIEAHKHGIDIDIFVDIL
jgi:hypothetical protein